MKMSGKIGVFQLKDSMIQLLIKDSLANKHDVQLFTKPVKTIEWGGTPTMISVGTWRGDYNFIQKLLIIF